VITLQLPISNLREVAINGLKYSLKEALDISIKITEGGLKS
jgi:hypothetical protein